MAVSRRTFTARPTPRRRTVWARDTEFSNSLTAGVATVRDLLTAARGKTLAGFAGWTLLRTHIHFYLASTSGPNMVRAGLIVKSLSDPPLSTEGPVAKPDLDWLAIITQCTDGTQAFTSQNRVTNKDFDYDFKSKRRLTETDSSVFLVVEYSGAGSFSSASDLLLAAP